MKILIDCQALQTGSAFRGIGRYAEGLINGLIQQGNHEISLLINGTLLQSKNYIQSTFENKLPPSAFYYWYSTAPQAECTNLCNNNTTDSDLIYEQKVLETECDLLLIPSLFESAFYPIEKLHKNIGIAVVVHDFIPYRNPHKYLPNNDSKAWYKHCLTRLAFADLLLCNSTYTARESSELFPNHSSVPILAGVDSSIFFNSSDTEYLRKKFDISSRYILYAGGTDERKNVGFLIGAYSKLTSDIRKNFKLVIVCGKHEKALQELKNQATKLGLSEQEIILLGYVSDSDLQKLYSSCYLFVFPSLEEGFGFPVLEAMKCGAPVICSNTSSLPEIHGYPDGQFSPFCEKELVMLLTNALTNSSFYSRLKKHSYLQQSLFSWENTANICIQEFEKLLKIKKCAKRHPLSKESLFLHLAFRKRAHDERLNLAVALSKEYDNKISSEQN